MQPVHEAIVEYVRTGTPAEKVGATMAWYCAYPNGRHSSREDLADENVQAALADLRRQYRAACLAAFLASDDPDDRRDLSFGFTLDPAAYPPEDRPALLRARQIVTADPERYARILATAPRQPNE
ncbi:hypothetical protein ABIA39_006518 [Nocardia sp. GAS34]|uniref:hypothetical protein n=1 Tax=Nocardia sp. GP40 TaxID=3156268 RepID=UPI003D20899E